MTDTATQQSRICPECGAKRPINATSCPVCGTPKTGAEAGPRSGVSAKTAGPAKTAEPAKAAGPAAPAKMAGPAAPAKMAEPAAPAKAAEPAAPAKTAEPAGPAKAIRADSRGRPEAKVDQTTSETTSRPRPAGGNRRADAKAADSKPSPSFLDRLRKLDGLGAVRRLVALAALVVILLAVGYAILPFKTGRNQCSPAVVQVLDRQRLTLPSVPGGPPGPPVTAPPAAPAGATPTVTPKGVLKPCTEGAKRRLYYAGPIVVLALLGSAGARKALA